MSMVILPLQNKISDATEAGGRSNSRPALIALILCSTISLTIYQLSGLAAAALLDRGTGKIDAGVDLGEIVKH